MSEEAMTEFLLARVGEDELLASVVPVVRFSDNPRIESHSPARVLRECEAKRRIVQRMETTRGQVARGVEMGFPNEFARVALVAYEDDVRTLASIYADHPDFREEWRP